MLATLAWAGFPGGFGAFAETSAPGAPANVSAHAGALSAVVQWTPTGSLATSYTVTSNPRGVTATVDGGATSATVTGLAFATSYAFTVAGTNSSGTGPSSAASNAVTPIAPGGPYHQGAPRVLVDSDLTAGQPQPFNVGEDRVHAPGLSAVVLNVTASQATAATGVQVVVRDQVAQTVSVAPGQVESSLVVVSVAQQMNPASLQLTAGQAHVEVDFVGYFSDERTVRDQSGLLQMIRTTTVLDATVPAGSASDVPMLGQGDVPHAGVAGVLVNVMAINPAAAGSVSLLPQGTGDPGTTTLGFAAGQTTANRAIVPLPANGTITLLERGAAAEVRVDVLGWFSDGTDREAVGALYTRTTPTREVDTAAQGGPVPAGTTVTFPVWGQAGAPDGSAPGPTTSGMVQITVTSPAGAGSIVISGTSMIDFAPGQTVAGTALVQVAMPAGSASFTVIGAATNVTVDLVAYFSGDLIMPGSTKVLTSAQLAGITNLGANSITFAPGVQVSPPVRLNDVINAGSSAATPSGLLRRVLSISTAADGSTILGTRTASIPEALTTFFLDWTLPPIAGAFGMSNGGATRTIASAAPRNANPLPPPPGTSIDPHWPAFGIAKPPQGLLLDLSTDNPGLKSGSEIDVNDLEDQARINLVTNLGRGGKFTMQVGFGVGLRASIDIQLLAQVNLLDRKNLLDTFFPVGPPIFIWIGFFIFEFEPGIDASLEFKVSLAGGAILHVGLDRYVEISGGYDGKNFFVDPVTNKDYLTPQQEFNWRPSIQLEFELDLHIDPAIAFYGGVAKIAGDAVGFARFTVDPTAPHWWDVTLGLCRAFEFKLNLIFLTADVTTPPVCLTLTAFEAPGRFLPITITPSAATVARSGTQHFHASIPLSVNGVSWTVQEPGGGTLSNVTQFDVDYMAPAKAGKYHLLAASLDDPTSTAQAEITVPLAAPSPPSGVLAGLTGPTSLNVTWNPPVDDGGATLTGYQVTSSPAGIVVGVGATTQVASFTGLTPGTLYTFTVTATNSAGLTSAPSAPSPPIQIPLAGPMSVTPTAISFGTVALGQSASPQTVLVTADGSPLVISTVTLGGTNPGEFAIQSDSCSGQTVQPGNTCSFNVIYTPTVQIAASGVVTITDSDPTSPQSVTLTGSSPVQATSGVVPVRDIQMIDSQTGYAIEAFLGSLLLKTTDGGKTWNRLYLPGSDQANISFNGYNLRFIDAMHGFVGAYRKLQPFGQVWFILSTSDGGQTWQQINLPSGVGLETFWFSDSLHGWILGGGAAGPYATKDGGLTWSPQTLPNPIVASTPGCVGGGNAGLRFADASNGWVSALTLCFAPNGILTTETALVWTTNDGGTSWTVHQLPAGVVSIYDRIQVTGTSQMRQPGTLMIGSTSVEQVLIASDDGGATFTFTPLPVQNTQNVQTHAVTFSDGSHGVLLTTDGQVWRTSDAGATWQGGPLPRFVSSAGRINVYGYEAIDSPDGTKIWVTGDVFYGFILNGFIEYSADGGATWTVQLLGNGT
jgi:photosystem II stability/assembly factor-like uncharacterized protein